MKGDSIPLALNGGRRHFVDSGWRDWLFPGLWIEGDYIHWP